MPWTWASLKTAWAGVQRFAWATARRLGCLSKDGEPDSVQNDLQAVTLKPPPRGLGATDGDSLVLYPVLAAVAAHLPVPPVALEPAVLHHLHGPPGVAREPLEDAHVVRVAHADRAHRAGVLERDELPPCGDGVGDARERRVQEERIEVGRAQVAQGVLDGGLDLRGERVAWVVGEGLGAVLSAERCEPAYMLVGEVGNGVEYGDRLCLDP